MQLLHVQRILAYRSKMIRSLASLCCARLAKEQPAAREPRCKPKLRNIVNDKAASLAKLN